MTARPLTPREAALAGLLHDLGKLAQRAHPDETALRDAYRGQDFQGLEAAILPSGEHGRYTHRHALWTDFFFETVPAHWPDGLDLERLRGAAIRHHKPACAEDWIVAEADRLASGLERKKRDEEAEAAATGRAGFREAELVALVPRLDLGLDAPPAQAFRHAAEPLTAASLLPTSPQPGGQAERLRRLWDAWCEGWQGFALREGLPAYRFEQSLIALSERLLWAVPSSTVDQPDVSLHDHALAVAAIGSALAAFHAAAGDWAEASIRNRRQPKFRLVALDLSGIQSALFRLAGSSGAARVLRARSFLIAELVASAVQAVGERLGAPAASVLISAGGKAELLVAATADLEARLEDARAELDRWMIAHWQGDLALNLAASEPFPATVFEERGRGFPAVRAGLAARLEEAKHRPFQGWRSGGPDFVGTGVIAAPFGADGACVTCGVRPAVVQTALDGASRCVVCDAAYRFGQRLPKVQGFALVDHAAMDGEDAAAETVPMPFGFALVPWLARGAEAKRTVTFDVKGDAGSALPRPKAYVPLIDDPVVPRYRALGLDARGTLEAPPEAGDVMTFAHIAAEALEEDEHGGFRGRALLGILKADVDRLGQIFTLGLGKDRSPARTAQLSRLIDGYFARRLPALLERAFPATYTVYAGGDDLLLVTPWRHALPLALELREDFSAFAGGNPNLSLSAGIAFVHPQHPIALAAAEAEEMLEGAKDAGRNRLGLFGRTLSWAEAKATLVLAEALDSALRDKSLPPTFLHRMRGFAAMRDRVGTGSERSGDRAWAARWGYQRARFLDRAKKEAREELAQLLDRAVPPPGVAVEADTEIAMTIALWRNR